MHVQVVSRHNRNEREKNVTHWSWRKRKCKCIGDIFAKHMSSNGTDKPNPKSMFMELQQ